jgi:catechol 2,3-dioxygenase-like lactoylglutathione lyase family enzyme
MQPFAVRRLDHLVLRVTDLERSIEFYTRVLQCPVERRRDDLGLVHLRAGASLIDLVSVSGKLGAAGGAAAGAEGRNLDHLCLAIEPFDARALVEHLRRHGVEPKGPVASNFGAEGTGPSLYLSDPDGNTVELKGPSTVAPADRDR